MGTVTNPIFRQISPASEIKRIFAKELFREGKTPNFTAILRKLRDPIEAAAADAKQLTGNVAAKNFEDQVDPQSPAFLRKLISPEDAQRFLSGNLGRSAAARRAFFRLGFR